MTSPCPGTSWDTVAAAQALAQLAGVIGGFVFAGMVVLLGQPRPETDRAAQQAGSDRLRALTPFIATFIAMGLNAYVFGLIAGEAKDACRRAWTATAIASGMLAIGTVATICGLILLVRAYLARHNLSDSDKPQLANLERVLRVTLWLTVMVALGLLVQRVYEYLNVWHAGAPPGLAWLLIPVLLIGFAGVVWTATKSGRLKRFIDGPAGVTIDYFDRDLFRAGLLTVSYSIVGAALVGLFLGVLLDWDHVPGFIPWLVAAWVIGVPSLAIGAWARAIRGITRLTHAPPPPPG
ncbi:hypothetical protein [Allorhizocola rhizosphaerae]|uniref:hypothetical protein n=1 Tax=Allorhizocola rhizosphaerae TaxID=1872709 RepID=UPI000E3BC6DA|nr:hypothetical protein [Allorhizocola rhizosphaerae]